MTATVVGCGPGIYDEGTDPAAESTSDTLGTTSPANSETTLVPTSSSGIDATTSPDASGSDSTGSMDIGVVECDLFEQDCPPGYKCNSWANDGGNSPTAMRCVPVVDEPAAVGEPCTVEAWPGSGLDDCEYGAMCWGIDPETLEGVCHALCVGSWREPVCLDRLSRCGLASDTVFALCMPGCHPLAQDCDPGSGCYPINDWFECQPDGSGAMGGPGDPCDAQSDCDPGVFCAGSAAVPGCATRACCSSLCDLGDPGSPCLAGQSCEPWYGPSAPPVFMDVGGCAALR